MLSVSRCTFISLVYCLSFFLSLPEIEKALPSKMWGENGRTAREEEEDDDDDDENKFDDGGGAGDQIFAIDDLGLTEHPSVNSDRNPYM